MAERIEKLEGLAREMVGDGQRPNVYFVTDGGNVTMITTNLVQAYGEWRALAARYPLRESTLEDRLTGVLASVEPISDEPGARLVVLDDTAHLVTRNDE